MIITYFYAYIHGYRICQEPLNCLDSAIHDSDVRSIWLVPNTWTDADWA